ncbi:ABC-three component system middle component 1 [Muricoccus pecuniae]|uniref:Uncharacterized protein n=1 Tax=Muricoccus pecuniae TaxID=693023 RepID=A0A840YMM1_9PROT|nr:ABC-three component system middle component 1 [Roseomonas pecuniae]MBB5695944.1 hypothetical protein [Roseomonas pecuniae]
MTEGSGSPGADTLAWVAAALSALAINAGLEANDAPRLVADTFDGGRGEPSASLEARDLPLVRRGLSVGRHAVVLGLLPETADERELADTMRQHRNQCVVARSALQPNAALDLLLIMVGPRGSEGKDAWRAIALGVERDDRVARKLVWLRPDDARADADSFDAFAKRTFLARPWATPAQFSIASLDDIAAIVNAGDVPRDTAGKWNRLAVKQGDEPDALVEGLVKVWAERSAT